MATMGTGNHLTAFSTNGETIHGVYGTWGSRKTEGLRVNSVRFIEPADTVEVRLFFVCRCLQFP